MCRFTLVVAYVLLCHHSVSLCRSVASLRPSIPCRLLPAVDCRSPLLSFVLSHHFLVAIDWPFVDLSASLPLVPHHVMSRAPCRALLLSDCPRCVTLIHRGTLSPIMPFVVPLVWCAPLPIGEQMANRTCTKKIVQRLPCSSSWGSYLKTVAALPFLVSLVHSRTIRYCW